MHPDISRFPLLHFYENKQLDGAQKTEKSAPFHDHSCLGPYMFFDIVDSRELLKQRRLIEEDQCFFNVVPGRLIQGGSLAIHVR